MRRVPFIVWILCSAALVPGLAAAGELSTDLGRNEVRIYSGRFQIEAGRTIHELFLQTRLGRLGYERRRGARPQQPGEYFVGTEKFWIYRHEVRIGGKRHPARLIGLRLRPPHGMILEGMDAQEQPLHKKHFWLDPELLAESFDPQRALTIPIDLEELPDHVWQAVLATEDARFFEHSGLDAKALARAMLKNAKAGRVVQGGSTITQQLVKMRDLSPKRSLGRKASEAVRALALEAEYDKEEILEAYLDAVYLGHLEGIQIFGFGAAAQAFFSKPASELTLEESALLAAMVQGPNRLNPVRNPDNARERYDWVLSRMVAVDWLEPARMHVAQRKGLPRIDLRGLEGLRLPLAPHFLQLLQEEAEKAAPKRSAEGRGVVIYSTLDPLLQQRAELAVRLRLERLKAERPALRNQPLSVALVALDGRSGNILAYVGGDPDDRQDRFDRARRASRQPGSTVKPFILLEAFEDCGSRSPLFPARQVSDLPLTLDLPTGPWSPQNPDRRNRPSVTLRQATRLSLNLPFLRVARWCGLEATADTLRKSGLGLPADLPPAFVLGAVETTPLEMAGAYTVFASLGTAWQPRPFERVFLPGGRKIATRKPRGRRVVKPESAYLARDLLASVAEGHFRPDDHQLYGKTGTSSDSRDAWYAGGAGDVVAVIWIGLDDNQRLGLSGGSAAYPTSWDLLHRAMRSRAPIAEEPPSAIIERWIELDTGLLVPRDRQGAELEIFRRGALPAKRRLLRKDRPLPVIE